MNVNTRQRLLGLAALVFVVLATAAIGGRHFPLGIPTPNASGVAQTLVAGREVSRDEPFFQSLGTNGRACVTCHVPTEGWSIDPADVQRRFHATGGAHPLFRPVDGATSPYADVRTVAARRQAYALLLSRGLIRVGLSIPPAAEFDLIAVDDPYAFASARELSLFRRPLPSTNLSYITTVMWDGRETPGDRAVRADLLMQANDATVGHAQAAPIDELTRRRIVDFEMRLTTAQTFDRVAGRLTADHADGGPAALADQLYRPAVGPVFTIFNDWLTAVGRGSVPRQAIARGQLVFNTGMQGTRLMCASCHNAENAGSNTNGGFFDVGASRRVVRDPDLPLYTLQCRAGGAPIQTTDPGRALITGRCSDIGRFKVPVLRALAARAPYFHNGSAATVEDVIDQYVRKFGFAFQGTERADLIAFLKAL